MLHPFIKYYLRFVRHSVIRNWESLRLSCAAKHVGNPAAYTLHSSTVQIGPKLHSEISAGLIRRVRRDSRHSNQLIVTMSRA